MSIASLLQEAGRLALKDESGMMARVESRISAAFSGRGIRFGLPEIAWGTWWSFAVVVGGSIYESHSLSLLLDDPVSAIAQAVLVFAIACCLALLIQLVAACKNVPAAVKSRSVPARSTQHVVLAVSVLFLAVVCGVCWISYYPGVLSYDIAEQLQQISGNMELSDWNPILHTGMLWLCVHVGEFFGGGNKWLVIYSVCSIAAFLLVVAYLEHWLMQKGFKVSVCIAIVAFLGLCPIFPLMSFTPTRDVIFAYSFLMFLLALVDASTSECAGPGVYARLLLFGLIACQMRHNAPYAFLLSALVLLVVWKQRHVAGAVAAVAVSSLFFSMAIIPALGVASTPAVESLSVPLSQMAKVLTSEESMLAQADGSESEAAADARGYFAADIEYNPRFADPVKKVSFRADAFEEDKVGFFSAYVRLGLEHPIDYFVAAVELDMDYWYLFAETPDPVSNRVYLETETHADNGVDYPIGRKSLLPGIKDYYDSAARHEAPFMDWPVLGFVFSLAFPCSMILAVLYIGVRFGGKGNHACLLLALLLPFFLTYLVGPVANLRYVLPIYLILPLLFCLGLAGIKDARSAPRCVA